jgi:hypothetical protein
MNAKTTTATIVKSVEEPRLVLTLDAREAAFLAIVLGKRNGYQNEEFSDTAGEIYSAANRFAEEHYPGDFSLTNLAARERMTAEFLWNSGYKTKRLPIVAP